MLRRQGIPLLLLREADWPRLLILGLPALVLGLNMVWIVNLPWRFPGFVMVIYANSRMIQLVSGVVLNYVLLTGLSKKTTD